MTKAWYVSTCSDLDLAINEVESRIPCFTNLTFLNNGLAIFTIECRDYDIAFVERMIAPFV